MLFVALVSITSSWFSLTSLASKSVRYVLVDRSVVLGERPAHYWSRSEGAAFYSMLAAEEERYAEETAAEEGASDVESGHEVDPVLEEQPEAKRRVGGSSSP